MHYKWRQLDALEITSKQRKQQLENWISVWDKQRIRIFFVLNCFTRLSEKEPICNHADDDGDGNSDGVWWRTDIALIVSMRMAVTTWINNEKYQLHINKYNLCHFLKIAYTRFGCCCCCCYAVFRHALAGVFVREKTMIRCYQTAGCIDGM